MCNFIHKEHVELFGKDRSGIGYKLVDVGTDGKNRPITCNSPYEESEDGFIDWLSKVDGYSSIGDGFCFFFSISEAKRAQKLWREEAGEHATLKAIEFKNAMCRQTESKFITGHKFEIGLCASFRFLRTVM